jgi:uncharacterized membrane protein YtjA (UPF0391 family)
MNTVFALIAIIAGVLGSLIAFNKIQLDKFIDPGEAQDWHRKYGKIFKIISPIAAVLGLWFLLF